MHKLNPDTCPIKLEHIDTSGEAGEAYVTALNNRFSGEAAHLILQMMGGHSSPRFRRFAAAEFAAYCHSLGLPPWSENPPYAKGFDRLVQQGYLVFLGHYELTLELVARCFGYAPAPGIARN